MIDARYCPIQTTCDLDELLNFLTSATMNLQMTFALLGPSAPKTEKFVLSYFISHTHIRLSSPITPWQLALLDCLALSDCVCLPRVRRPQCVKIRLGRRAVLKQSKVLLVDYGGHIDLYVARLFRRSSDHRWVRCQLCANGHSIDSPFLVTAP